MTWIKIKDFGGDEQLVNFDHVIRIVKSGSGCDILFVVNEEVDDFDLQFSYETKEKADAGFSEYARLLEVKDGN